MLRTRVGSAVHDTAVDEHGDRDELGVCLEPAQSPSGPVRVLTPGGREIPFEQYELHTAWARSRGLAERSRPGDLDLVVYSARKWARLALDGNPEVLLPLWVPEEHLVRVTAAGRELRENAHRFTGRAVVRGYLRHLRAQRAGLGGRRNRRAARGPSAGFDVKAAVHACRAGVQGLELLRTGRITLPVPQPDLAALRSIRSGLWPLRDVQAWFTDLEADLADALSPGGQARHLPERADRTWMQEWLIRSEEEFWLASSDVVPCTPRG